MNKKMILVGALVGVLAGQSVMAMEVEQQEETQISWRDTLTSGNTLMRVAGTTLMVGGALSVGAGYLSMEGEQELQAASWWDNLISGKTLMRVAGITLMVGGALSVGAGYLGFGETDDEKTT